jgi:hypothetical protein
VTPLLKTIRSGEYLLTTPLYFVHRGDLIPSEVAMRYVRFLEAPATASWLKRRKLLPIREARLLNRTFAIREQRLLDLLRSEPIPASIVAPPTDAAPVPSPPESGTAP